MAYCAKLSISRLSDRFKLYIYRSTNADDINTIERIRNLRPVFTIDESQTVGDTYEVVDKSGFEQPTGCTYHGPDLNTIPCVEYETTIDIAAINRATYINSLVLNPLPLKYNGTMVYYSIIGVDEDQNTITHLSNVGGVLITVDFEKEGTRHIYSCDNYTESDEDEWVYVGAASWENEPIKIGDYTNTANYHQYGSSVVMTVKPLDPEKIVAQTRMTLTRNFFVMEIQNPWERNNEEFNYRKFKSFKICNVVDNLYSRFSEPTYQSLIPVSIEKMLILRKTDQEEHGVPISLVDSEAEDVEKWQVIKRDGIFYNAVEHRNLGLNKWNIPLEERIAVYNEASVQETINIQMPANVGHTYDFTFYLVDVYGNYSKPVTKTVIV